MASASAWTTLVWIAWTRTSWSVLAPARSARRRPSGTSAPASEPEDQAGHDTSGGQPAQLAAGVPSSSERADAGPAAATASPLRRSGRWRSAVGGRCRCGGRRARLRHGVSVAVVGIGRARLAGLALVGSGLGCEAIGIAVGRVERLLVEVLRPPAGAAARGSARRCPAAARRAVRWPPPGRCGRTVRCRTSSRAGWPPGPRGTGPTASGAARSRRPPPAGGGSRRARRRCSPRTRWWSGTGWPGRGSRDEDRHRGRVAGHDHDQVVAPVLHLLDQGVDGLLAVLVAGQAVGLVDEQHAAGRARRRPRRSWSPSGRGSRRPARSGRPRRAGPWRAGRGPGRCR